MSRKIISDFGKIQPVVSEHQCFLVRNSVPGLRFWSLEIFCKDQIDSQKNSVKIPVMHPLFVLGFDQIGPLILMSRDQIDPQKNLGKLSFINIRIPYHFEGLQKVSHQIWLSSTSSLRTTIYPHNVTRIKTTLIPLPRIRTVDLRF